MSHSSKARKKALRRAKDALDPERNTVRNMIKRGKVPRWSRIKTGAVFKEKIRQVKAGDEDKSKTQKAWYKEPGKQIVSSFGMIFEAKTIVKNRAAK